MLLEFKGENMSERVNVEVLKQLTVWNSYGNGSELRTMGIFSNDNELFEALKPYNITKDDFDYNDDIDCLDYDQPMAYLLDEGYSTTTYLILETYTLNELLYEEELKDFVRDNEKKRIFVRNSSEELFQEINKALDDELLDYDIDSGDRYLVNEKDLNEIIDIMESLGASVDII